MNDKKRPHDLHEFMRQISDEMASEYRRIYTKAAQDPGTAGDEGEATWAQLLKEWLPPNYHVETKGQLISADGELSPQIDVLILKPSYPKKLLKKGLAGGRCRSGVRVQDDSKFKSHHRFGQTKRHF